MDLPLACEALIPKVVDMNLGDDTINETDVERWQRHFGTLPTTLPTKSATGEVILVARLSLSWSMIRDNQRANGFDKEPYEYAAARQFHESNSGRDLQYRHSSDDFTSSYLLNLEGPDRRPRDTDGFCWPNFSSSYSARLERR